MKKIVLSSIVALALGTVSATAGEMKFYTDANGQVFVTPGEGRTELKANSGDVMDAFKAATQVSAKDMKEEIKAELKEEIKKDTPVFAKSSKLQFSGTHYLGYNYKSKKALSAADGGPKDELNTGNFEMRRNYFQVKAFVLDDPKSYLRVTLDATYDQGKAQDIEDGVDDHADVYVKYAYLYLNDILPYTGVEFGMAHRPWIDYEEHQGWWMRSISKVFVEASESAHLTNSADMGVNFKTKTPYFTSEVGLFNGEGYHGNNGDEEVIGGGNSVEWRATVAALGNGDKKRKPTKDSYLDASFFGQHNMDNAKNEVTVDGDEKSYDYTIMGVHAVYNTPSFLIAAQYVTSDNQGANEGDGTSEYNGKGYSINGTYRFGEKKQFSVLGRYDLWKAEQEVDNETYKTKNYIYGVTWQQNENFKWLLSGQSYRAEDNKSYKGSATQDWDSAMLTAEVHW